MSLFDISLATAFFAGLLSFASPCVLPIIPPYLAYLAGLSFHDLQTETHSGRISRQLYRVAIAFVLGFTTLFVALGATAGIVGKTMAQYYDRLAVFAGLLIILMGLHFIGLIRISVLSRTIRLPLDRLTGRYPSGMIGAYFMGLAFAFGWTPCVGPILSAILFLAGDQASAGRGALLLGAYALGIGLPFLVLALFAGRMLVLTRRLQPWMGAIEKAMGGFLIVIGIAFMTGHFKLIGFWLARMFPAFQQIG